MPDTTNDNDDEDFGKDLVFWGLLIWVAVKVGPWWWAVVLMFLGALVNIAFKFLRSETFRRWRHGPAE